MFDATFWAFIGLILFLMLLVFLKVPGKLTQSLDARAQKIRSELEEARRLREEAQALLAEYKRRQREAEREADEMLQQAERESQAMVREARQKLESYIERRTKIAEDKIAQAEAQAIQDIRRKSSDLAIATAKHIIESKVSGKIANDIITKSIQDIGTQLN